MPGTGSVKGAIIQDQKKENYLNFPFFSEKYSTNEG